MKAVGLKLDAKPWWVLNNNTRICGLQRLDGTHLHGHIGCVSPWRATNSYRSTSAVVAGLLLKQTSDCGVGMLPLFGAMCVQLEHWKVG